MPSVSAANRSGKNETETKVSENWRAPAERRGSAVKRERCRQVKFEFSTSFRSRVTSSNVTDGQTDMNSVHMQYIAWRPKWESGTTLSCQLIQRIPIHIYISNELQCSNEKALKENQLCGRLPQYAPAPASSELKSHWDYLCVWWSWPLTFWPWNWCGMSAVVRTTFLLILVFMRLFVVELWSNMQLDLRHDLNHLYLWGHRACPWCGSSYSLPVPSLKFVNWSPLQKIWRIFRLSVNRPRDLDFRPFDL